MRKFQVGQVWKRDGESRLIIQITKNFIEFKWWYSHDEMESATVDTDAIGIWNAWAQKAKCIYPTSQ